MKNTRRYWKNMMSLKNQYQIELYEKFSKFRLARDEDSPYPPYHQGDYLEEYFIAQFRDSLPDIESIFIPVCWTAVFNFKVKEGLNPGSPNFILRQELFKELKSLDSSYSYFTVSTHDDAPQGEFPGSTTHFAAGGNTQLGSYIPIPLVASGYESFRDSQKMIFCSFLGSITHPIREAALVPIHKTPGYYINIFEWSANIPEDRAGLFKNAMEQSRFSLCPRGYGATSYRLYEAIQLGSIPVYISDKFLLPWSDEINWEDFCVIIPPDKVPRIHDILSSFTEQEIRKMQYNLKNLYAEYFNIPAIYYHVIKRVENF